MIQFEDVGKMYPATSKGGEPTIAVQEFSLRIEDGEFCSIVGPSGCGKTTILNMLAGFETPTRGQIVVGDDVVTKPGPERTVVFQRPSLLPWMTVSDNIGFGLTIRDKNPKGHQQEIMQMVEEMGLSGFESHFPYQLSGGMQQRVSIARALITDPTSLLMDEPFGALDAQTRSDMQRFLLELWKTSQPTVLFITHDVDEAILLSDRVVVMTPRPGMVAEEFSIELKRPRKWDSILSTEFLRYKKQILSVLRQEAG